MKLKLSNYKLRIHTNIYKDYFPYEYIITPYIHVDYYSSKYYYEKRYTIGLCWLYWDIELYMYVNKD